MISLSEVKAIVKISIQKNQKFGVPMNQLKILLKPEKDEAQPIKL